MPDKKNQRAELLAAIEKDLENPEPYLVYADYLQGQGDPHGELITLQHQLLLHPGDDALAAAADAVLKKHKKRFLGELGSHKGIFLEWQLGFIRGMRLIPEWRDDQAKLLGQFLDLPTARLLREVVIFSDKPEAPDPDDEEWDDGDEEEITPSKLKALEKKMPPTLKQIQFARKYESLEQALRRPGRVLWLELNDEPATAEITRLKNLKNLEWLDLSGQVRKLPEELASLEKLRRLDVDFCFDLRQIPDEIFGIESLAYFSCYDTGLPKAYHMGRLNNLLQGFIRARTPRRRRMIELNLLLGREPKARKLADADDLLAALDNNVAQVREAALGCLAKVMPDPLKKRPIGEGSEVAALGSLNMDRKQLKARLEKMGARLTTKAGKKTTHVLLGQNPRGRQKEAGDAALVLEGQLQAFLAAGAPADEAPAADVDKLGRWLRKRDEKSAGKAVAAMKEGGVPEELLAELLLVCQDVSFKNKVRNDAKKLFALHAPEALKKAVTKHLKTSLLLDVLGETKRGDRIESLCRAAKVIDPLHLAGLLLDRAGVGTKYLLEHGDLERIQKVLYRMRKGPRLALTLMELEELPEELGRLEGLVDLDVSQNHFYKLPPPILELVGLERLVLSHNKLRALPGGIGRLSALRVLDLSYNRFTRFPGALTALGSLSELDLNSEQYAMFETRIDGLPDDIGRMSGLRKLAFGFNIIGAFPESFFELEGLEELDLSLNKLPREIPEELARLKKLRRLKVGGSTWGKKHATLKKLLPKCRFS